METFRSFQAGLRVQNVSMPFVSGS